MKQVRDLDAQCTRADFFRNLPSAVNNRPFEVIDNCVIVYDKDRTVNITVHDEPLRKLGSLELPMEKIKFEFSGYSDAAADEFMDTYREHSMRCGGG